MDSMSLLEAKTRRTTAKAALTRHKNAIESFNATQGSRHDIEERKRRLSELWEQFDLVQLRIEILENADPANKDTNKDQLRAQQDEQRSSFEVTYFAVISRCQSLLEYFDQHNPRTSSLIDSNARAPAQRESRVKLPKIELPSFSGAYDDWYSYHDTFEKLIHVNGSLNEIEKFHYLRSSLKDKAAEVIKSIETTTDNYDHAWTAIKERYDNKRWIIQKHIRAIFDAPTLLKENHVQLRELLDTILKHLRALRAIKRPTETWDDLIIHIITSKLDSVTSKAWETSIPDKDIPSLKSLTDFLSKRCQALETVFSKLSINPPVTSKPAIRSRGSSVTNLATSNLSCPQCKETHPLYFCEAFLKLPTEKRLHIVKRAHLCINCLRSSSHNAKDCTSSSCRKCSKKHNTLLHFSSLASDKNVPVANEPTPGEREKSIQPVVTQCLSTHHSLGVVLSTAIVYAFDHNNEMHPCRVLLDSGSQMNFVTQEFANKLHLKEQAIDASISGVVQGTIQAKKMINIRIKSRFNQFNENVGCIILSKITQQLPQRFISRQELTIPNHIRLADPNFNVPADIDMLIGAELFWRLICAGQIRTARDQPAIQKTLLGWIISGPSADYPTPFTPSITSCLAVTEDLNRAISRFWEVDHAISSPEVSPEQRVCERFYLNTVKRNKDGRFIVQLPIKEDKLMNLGSSEETAARRFKHLEKRLIKSPRMYEEYKRFMEEYIQLGHMREVTQYSHHVDKIYFLPHHAVYKETSTTTKLRVVFDASAKTSTGTSLNDTLMVGPTIQDDLFSILIRFRSFKYALTADIKKMYRQVLLDPAQVPLQRIFWRDSEDKPIRTYELLTVTYGTASAAFLAIRSLRKLAEDNSSKYPIGARTVLNDFYVDDLVTGAETLQEALAIKSETSHLLLEGLFELHKWASNDSALQDNQPSAHQKEFVLSDDKESETRTLGLIWNCGSDHFKYSSFTQLPALQAPTKRSILSRIALIFDPLGLLGPSTVVAKLIIQELWRLSLDWDESLPLDINTKWKRYEDELPSLKDITIPRRVISLDQYISLELHGFSDASELAYGACIYLRATGSNGPYSVNLLCSKGRIAPLKGLSIPRLELCAALLLARLTDKVLKSLTCKIESVYLWTDSTIVLAWLQAFSRTWTTFVANRVGEIQQLTTIQDWHHVSSKDNPADLLSRGVSPALLAQSQLWWSGPSWLNLSKEDWPQFPYSINQLDIPETKSTAITTVTIEASLDIFERYSSLMKLLRVISYIFRFFNKLKQKGKHIDSLQTHVGSISANEIARSTQALIKLVQRRYFSKELELLARQQDLKISAILRLNPFIDETGILRVGGRLKFSPLPYDAKHPVLLPGRHPFSRLIVMHEHQRHLHAGAQATLAAVRQNYWLISARDVTRQILRKCIICIRRSPKMASTLMGNLPKHRITVPERPFSICGIDYAGPFYIKEGARKTAKSIKCYMAIFVCFATTAVHIELATDLTTEAFLSVLKRFISRRGYPSDIYSDNGLNFKGACRELTELAALFNNQLNQQQIVGYVSPKGINWHFTPPRAPHQGGLWEAAVKSAKRHILHITKDTHLRYEELETLLVQVEAILNSRPLTPLSSDSHDLTPLTPGHFLIGGPLTSYPEVSLEKLPINRLSRWQYIEQLRQHFWKRWLREYLHHHQHRTKWMSKETPVRVGQIVLLQEDSVSPLSWPLAKIQAVHPGDDDIIRTVTLRTARGVYKRPLTRLCLLPCQD